MPTPLQDASLVIPATCAALAAFIAARGVILWRRVRGTTLAAPTVWLIVAALFMAAVELTLAAQRSPGDTLGASIARYAAAVGILCPLMAVLGAKRPQDRGWQWVVLSLWIILLVPAGQTWAAQAATRVALAPAWQMMLFALIALGLLNYLPTRNAVPALATAAAQYVLLRPFWSDLTLSQESISRLAAFTALALAATKKGATKKGDWSMSSSDGPAPLHATPPRTNSEKAPGTLSNSTHHFNSRWLTFRNAWGAFWALRILQRVNEAAQLSNWPVRLEWSGFVLTSNTSPQPLPLDERTSAHVEQTLDTLLRRFERTSS